MIRPPVATDDRLGPRARPVKVEIELPNPMLATGVWHLIRICAFVPRQHRPCLLGNSLFKAER